MFALIKLIDEDLHDVCEETMIKCNSRGQKFIYKGSTEFLVDVLGYNKNQYVLEEIKTRKNQQLPKLVLETIEEVTPPVHLPVKRVLFDDGISKDPFDSDDSIKDPNYRGSKYELSSDDETSSGNDGRQTEDQQNKKLNCLLKNTTTKNSKAPKKNYCLYCKLPFSKITPHLERKHPDEMEVKGFLDLPKGTRERKQKIETIRRHGNFLFGKEHNKYIVPVRRTTGPTNYKVCPSCKGYFSLSSIRKHYRNCQPNYVKGKRNLLVMSRRLQCGIHSLAGTTLRNEIFPVLRDDNVTNVLKYDKLVMIYGNNMCAKYRSQHHHNMIRARLRLIGRLLLEAKKQAPYIADLSSVFQASNYDTVIKSVNIVASLDEKKGSYKSPAVAFALGTALKYICNLHISECIKCSDILKKNQAEDFLKLLKTDLPTSVNKTVQENQLQMKRQKAINLPSNEDIRKLHCHLKKQRTHLYEELLQKFSETTWKELASYTLISLQLFNRRRAGEIERILIDDFRNYHSVDENNDLFRALSEESKKAAKQYIRFTIRGKLARGVPVLLHKEIFECIQLILKHRKDAGVTDENPYVFGISHPDRIHHLQAYRLLVRFSEECGASNPKLLRGTSLRKHIATQCILLDLKENEVQDLANFLGHHEKIHREHYRMPVATRDITVMSRLLEMAQGDDDENFTNELDGHDDIPEKENSRNNSEVVFDGHDDADKNTVTENVDRCDDFQEPGSSRNTNEVPFEHDVADRNTNAEDTMEEDVRYEVDIPKTPPKRKIRELTRWITPERRIINKVFYQHLVSGPLPSFTEIREAQEKYPILRKRKLPVIKTHVSNEIKRRSIKRPPLY